MIKFGLFLSIFCLLSCKSFTQSVTDTTLYLLYEEREDTQKIDKNSFPTKNKDIEPSYYFHNLYLYDGYPLEFKSIDYKKAETVRLHQLEQYKVFTPEHLSQFVSKNYKSRGENAGYYGSPYFNNLKHIYIIEKDKEKGIATITEVKLDVQRE